MVADDTVFTTAAFRYVDMIVRIVALEAFLLAAVNVFLSYGVNANPPALSLGILLLVVAAMLVWLLMLVMRHLLEKATTLREGWSRSSDGDRRRSGHRTRPQPDDAWRTGGAGRHHARQPLCPQEQQGQGRAVHDSRPCDLPRGSAASPPTSSGTSRKVRKPLARVRRSVLRRQMEQHVEDGAVVPGACPCAPRAIAHPWAVSGGLARTQKTPDYASCLVRGSL